MKESNNEYLQTTVRIGIYDFKFSSIDLASKFMVLANEHISDEDRPIRITLDSYFAEIEGEEDE